MIWVLLAMIGIVLWLIAISLGTIVFRNRSLRKRPGNVGVRIRAPGEARWSAGHAVWIHDVFAFRGSPAAWKESVVWVTDAFARQTTPEERRRLRRIGDEPVVARLWLASGERIDVAARARDRETVLGPFAGLEGTNGRGHEATVRQRIREER